MRNYPGGPAGYLFDQQNAPVMTIGNCASILISIIADGLLVGGFLMIQWHMFEIIEEINSCIVSSYSGITGGTLSSSMYSFTSLQSVCSTILPI